MQHVPEHSDVLEGEYLQKPDNIASGVQMRFMVHCCRAITVIFLFLLLSVLSFLPSFDLPKADRREKRGGDVISDGIMVWVL